MSVEREKSELVATIGATGQGRVTLDGRDISNRVIGLAVDTIAGQLTKVELRLGVLDRVDITSENVSIPAKDEAILRALGWHSPEDARELVDEVRELRARVLRDRLETLPTERDTVLDRVAEALGKYAPAEVKWSRVLEEVSELAARMEGLEK